MVEKGDKAGSGSDGVCFGVSVGEFTGASLTRASNTSLTRALSSLLLLVPLEPDRRAFVGALDGAFVGAFDGA